MTELRNIPPGPDRERYLPLLLLADAIAASYLNEGDLGVYGDGVVLTIPADEPGTVELKNVAVAESVQGKGIGRAMIAAVLDELRKRDWRRAIVGTGTADPRTYIFHQRCGFRPWRIERDVFTPGRGYDPADLFEANGLVHRDMIWLDLDLSPGDTKP